MTPSETRFARKSVEARLKAEADERHAYAKVLVQAAGMRAF